MVVVTAVKTGEISGEAQNGKERVIMAGEPEGGEQEIMGGCLRNGRTLEGKRMDIILRGLNRVTIISTNTGKMMEGGIKEAMDMRTVEGGRGKMIGEGGTLAKEQI